MNENCLCVNLLAKKLHIDFYVCVCVRGEIVDEIEATIVVLEINDDCLYRSSHRFQDRLINVFCVWQAVKENH